MTNVGSCRQWRSPLVVACLDCTRRASAAPARACRHTSRDARPKRNRSNLSARPLWTARGRAWAFLDWFKTHEGSKPNCPHIGKKTNLHQRGVQNGTRHVRGRPLTRLGVQKTGQAQASSDGRDQHSYDGGGARHLVVPPDIHPTIACSAHRRARLSQCV